MVGLDPRGQEAGIGNLSQEFLEEALRLWVPAVRYLEETDSTNRIAMEWGTDGAVDRSLVVADSQTAGRGRLDRSWFSPPGSSLLFSLVLRPGIVVEDLSLLNLAAAVSVAGAISESGAEARVKWPNDVLIDGRKVAGILAEASVELGRAVLLVLGIGINVNIAEEEFPEELRQTATSIMSSTGGRQDRVRLLVRFLQRFKVLYEGLPTHPAERILAVYKPLCETLGKRVRVELPDETFEDEAIDIHANGGLVLASGRVVRVGDVVHLR